MDLLFQGLTPDYVRAQFSGRVPERSIKIASSKLKSFILKFAIGTISELQRLQRLYDIGGCHREDFVIELFQLVNMFNVICYNYY